MTRFALLLLLLLPSTVRAEPFSATYATYAGLLSVLDMEVSIDLRPGSYGVRVVTHTAGPVRVFFRSDMDTTAAGSFGAAGPRPQRFSSEGRSGGEARTTLIEFRDGQPTVRTLTPPNEADGREDIPAVELAGTVDSVSAMAWLIRRVTDTGRCDGTLQTFDGRRKSVLVARTAGEEVLAPTGRSSFTGPALRCEFEGRQVAGFRREDDLQWQKRPQNGTAWFARPAAGRPALPVRVVFANRILGEATMYITSPLPAPPGG